MTRSLMCRSVGLVFGLTLMLVAAGPPDAVARPGGPTLGGRAPTGLNNTGGRNFGGLTPQGLNSGRPVTLGSTPRGLNANNSRAPGTTPFTVPVR
ncbi:MAG TPA: hypothetical protein VGD13_13695 [Xanthobacteraceae bacterium]|jgi:hypothetical protein